MTTIPRYYLWAAILACMATGALILGLGLPASNNGVHLSVLAHGGQGTQTLEEAASAIEHESQGTAQALRAFSLESDLPQPSTQQPSHINPMVQILRQAGITTDESALLTDVLTVDEDRQKLHQYLKTKDSDDLRELLKTYAWDEWALLPEDPHAARNVLESAILITATLQSSYTLQPNVLDPFKTALVNQHVPQVEVFFLDILTLSNRFSMGELTLLLRSCHSIESLTLTANLLRQDPGQAKLLLAGAALIQNLDPLVDYIITHQRPQAWKDVQFAMHLHRGALEALVRINKPYYRTYGWKRTVYNHTQFIAQPVSRVALYHESLVLKIRVACLILSTIGFALSLLCALSEHRKEPLKLACWPCWSMVALLSLGIIYKFFFLTRYEHPHYDLSQPIINKDLVDVVSKNLSKSAQTIDSLHTQISALEAQILELQKMNTDLSTRNERASEANLELAEQINALRLELHSLTTRTLLLQTQLNAAHRMQQQKPDIQPQDEGPMFESMEALKAHLQDAWVTLSIQITEDQPFGKVTSNYALNAPVVRYNKSLYALVHTQHLPFKPIHDKPTIVLFANAGLQKSLTRLPVTGITFIAEHPQIMAIPLDEASVQSLQVKPLELSARMTNEGIAISPENDLDTLSHLTAHIDPNNKQYATFDPAKGISTGDWVTNRSGRFLGMIVNDTHLMHVDRITPTYTINLGQGFEDDILEKVLSMQAALVDQLSDAFKTKDTSSK